MTTTRKSSSVAKAFELIQVIADGGPDGVGLQDLAARAQVAVSTAHRYVTSLLDLGVVERDGAGVYRLGVGLVRLAGQYLEEDVLLRVAHPYLVELAGVSGETAHLGVPIGDHIVYVDKVESDQSVRLVSRIGSEVPLHCTSMGKALLSLMPPDERAARLAGDLARPTPKTLFGDSLAAELERVREQGYALDDEENELGVRCIGLPIVNASGEPVAAFSVSAPASRFTADACHDLAPTALRIAHEIGAALGYAGATRRNAG
ncbi:IclR family transcriptional regulator [Mumia sp. Pv 4-285]|uniref:IclR family transcriptional regulator n=1 Tax=Mumia qirimensis TaxID=3234852 RepID=UPI00351D09DB